MLIALSSSAVRLTGGIVNILYENQPSNIGLLVAAFALLNVGVFPCITATIGLINIMCVLLYTPIFV